ncbi:MAG: hypothetical protein JRH18_23170 [Deltaproteobacteria bacterium]|nr:hypothetical protein [Deltaproteobacteria bacterium]MBW2154548.1 hypothetical protein [Deltaproteobacteria bacterium]
MTFSELLNQSAEELFQSITAHRDLLASANAGPEKEIEIKTCVVRNCSHRQRLKEVLAETIDILEQTRKNFSS